MRTYILNATGTDISPATIIICVVIAAICIFAVISYRKKLKNGCCGGGGDEVKHVKPQDTNVNDYDHVYRMDIEGMHCKNCAMRIENAFNEQPDRMAKVDLARQIRAHLHKEARRRSRFEADCLARRLRAENRHRRKIRRN